MPSRAAVIDAAPAPISFRALTKLYYQLTKPGIVYSNTLTAVAGYLYASWHHIDLLQLAGLLTGTAGLIAASCVLNNYLDRGLDAHMARTQKRASVTGTISLTRAMVFAVLLLAGGFAALLKTNGLTMVVGALAVLSYVAAYGVAKRKSVHGTLVGTLPGAASLVAGYTAATGRLDLAALGLFLIMVIWQMPHFYAISIFRRDDYARAGLPVRSVSKGIANTKRHIVAYIILYILASCSMIFIGHEHMVYTVVMATLGLSWLVLALRGWHASDDVRWARQIFGRSLIILLAFCVVLPLGVLLP